MVEGCHGRVGVGEPVSPNPPLTTPLARLRPPAQLKKKAIKFIKRGLLLIFFEAKKNNYGEINSELAQD